ncbi:hypothetical protein [Ferviditalea candida]|uniref:Uncharacterized protein n=1 Tax=Ferviditalea candida TaxID=3108399 RepID=A0ABU5ZEV4_9BACL|nr:hypothetical protein [Paenibacillaceae bacterium T2]
MNSNVSIPKGDDKIVVELTVKEAIALSGTRFNEDPGLVFEARKKLKHFVEDKLEVGRSGKMH